MKSPNLPSVIAPDYTEMKSGANSDTLQVPYYVSPGRYKITFPVTQSETVGYQTIKTVRYATATVTLNAKASVTRAASSILNFGWTVGRTATFDVTLPEYQAGAKVTLYYKKKGAKKYSKIVSKKLVVKKGSYSAKAELKTKKLTKSGHIYFKVSGVSYASGYKTKAAKVTVTRR